ncbi:MAG: alpha/beta fold hydrolase [Anaerolineae bacterium]|nr:alpha/beta fold hydrolase [Anaerolineae bacterium]
MTGTIESNGGTLYYEIAGEGPTLVLGHAGFVDSRMWDAQWEAFAQHYRVIRYDMRGFGKSDPATQPVDRRDDLLNVLDALKVERAVLIGCSMSGTLALDFALGHPDRVSALVLVSATPSGFEMQGEPPPAMMEMFAAFQQGDLKRASELQIQLWVDGGFRKPSEVDPEVRRAAAEMNLIAVKNRTFAIADSQPINPLDPPAVERLTMVAVPTLIIVGALDHPEILRAAEVMKQAIAHSQRIDLPQSAHVPNMEKPAAFNQAVLAFLDGTQLS